MPTIADLQAEVAHQQRADRIRSAHARLERLLDEQDRLATPWPSAAVRHRRGVVSVAIRHARERLAQLEAEQAVERMVGLPPLLDAPVQARGKPGLPPTWWVGPWPPPQAHAPRTATPPRRTTTRNSASSPAGRRRGRR
jgi:hypothetical protein